jgi:hypothetical protein
MPPAKVMENPLIVA